LPGYPFEFPISGKSTGVVGFAFKGTGIEVSFVAETDESGTISSRLLLEILLTTSLEVTMQESPHFISWHWFQYCGCDL
jgi:hypothetical protein